MRTFGIWVGRALIAMCAIIATPALAAQAQSLGKAQAIGFQARVAHDGISEEHWLVPSSEPGVALHTTVFKPSEQNGAAPARRPLVIINHGTDAAKRHTMARPRFIALSRWFVERGYVVVLPLRRGYGATGGTFGEGRDWCASPDHSAAGQVAADDIESTLGYFAGQAFVDARNVVVAGVSSGAWASLAFAARNPAGVRAVVNFSGGRGAYAWGRAGQICGLEKLVASADEFGASARIPTLWLYAENDTYFAPAVARAMHSAWTRRGGRAELHILPPHGREGHELASARNGKGIWGGELEQFILGSVVADARHTTHETPTQSANLSR